MMYHTVSNVAHPAAIPRASKYTKLFYIINCMSSEDGIHSPAEEQ